MLDAAGKSALELLSAKPRCMGVRFAYRPHARKLDVVLVVRSIVPHRSAGAALHKSNWSQPDMIMGCISDLAVGHIRSNPKCRPKKVEKEAHT